MPVRGNLSNTFVRNDLKPVSLPSQNGELVLSAKTCGRKYRAELAMCTAISLDGIPTCTCKPKIRLLLAASCISFTISR